MSVTKDTYRKYDEIDWGSVQWDFENTKCSLAQLAKKYGTYPMMISRVVKDKKWDKFSEGETAISSAIAKFDERQASIQKPSAILETIGVRKAEEIVRELGIHYSAVDEPLVIAYSESYQRYLKLAKEVNEEGVVKISPKTGGEYLNPKFNAMQALKGNIKDLGNQLGLSIASRKRLSLDFGVTEQAATLFDAVASLSACDADLDV